MPSLRRQTRSTVSAVCRTARQKSMRFFKTRKATVAHGNQSVMDMANNEVNPYNGSVTAMSASKYNPLLAATKSRLGKLCRRGERVNLFTISSVHSPATAIVGDFATEPVHVNSGQQSPLGDVAPKDETILECIDDAQKHTMLRDEQSAASMTENL
ncbi:hypothetical protein K470DRAFT_277657, partial [Piedraia hortae CBS 480.64]